MLPAESVRARAAVLLVGGLLSTLRGARTREVCGALDCLVEAQRKMGTVHFHLVATQGGDERRVRARREHRERDL